MLNFCPLCVAEVYALRRDAMRAGTSHYPLHHPVTTYYLYCKDMQFFLICKISTKQLVHYGYSILNSAILYKDLIDFPFLCHHFDDIVQI